MTRLRLLVWLVALMALIAPPGMSTPCDGRRFPGLVGRLPRSCAAARSLPERGNGQARRERLLPADVGRGCSAASSGRNRDAGSVSTSTCRCACAALSAAFSPRIHRLPASEPISSVHPFRHGEASCCSDVPSSASWRGCGRAGVGARPHAAERRPARRSCQGHAHHRRRRHRERLLAEVARCARRRDGALRRAQRRHGAARAHHRHGRRACRASQADEGDDGTAEEGRARRPFDVRHGPMPAASGSRRARPAPSSGPSSGRQISNSPATSPATTRMG